VKIDDPELVRAEYATEAGLEGRRAAYRFAEGPDPREIAFQAVAEARPQRVLEVGCGPGELAARIQDELGCEVIAVDLSPRMAELARGRGIEARVGDVQELPFANGEFDVAVAAWMLFHVPELERGLAELQRVLRPSGRLVAVTNGLGHMRELAELLGVEREPASFRADNGAALLRTWFPRVEARDGSGSVVFPDREAAQGFVRSTMTLAKGGELPPFDGPLRVRREVVVFVAERP
jgi:SAM-dependent methyltransferase